MKKHFVLDTNVLLHDPDAIFAFADNMVVLPIYVIEEIDKFKRDASELGRSARTVSRTLDGLRKVGHLAEGVPIAEGGSLRVVTTALELSTEHALEGQEMDARILATALDVQRQAPELPCILVTKDVNLRIRADALGLRAEDYERERTDIDELWTGIERRSVEGTRVEEVRAAGRVEPPRPDLSPNSFVQWVDGQDPEHWVLGKATPDGADVVCLPGEPAQPWGIRSRNLEQTCALDLLMDDRVSLVTLVGKAGTGKTLLAIAAALSRSTEVEAFQKVLISRPIFPLGRDLGYLPGTVEEKLNPWMQPIFDNVEFLLSLSVKGRKERSYTELIDMGLLQIEPLTYIRGRSIPNQYMIVDEAQNLTPHEVKTILTRAGQGTKVVLTGDPYQIDNPYMDASNNGLVHVLNRLRGESLSGHVTLVRGERSPLAEVAANRL